MYREQKGEKKQNFSEKEMGRFSMINRKKKNQYFAQNEKGKRKCKIQRMKSGKKKQYFFENEINRVSFRE